MAIISFHQRYCLSLRPCQPHTDVVFPALKNLGQLLITLAQNILPVEELPILLRQTGPHGVQAGGVLPQLHQRLRRRKRCLMAVQTAVVPLHDVFLDHRLVPDKILRLIFDSINNIHRQGGGWQVHQRVKFFAEALHGVLYDVLAVLTAGNTVPGRRIHQSGIPAVQSCHEGQARFVVFRHSENNHRDPSLSCAYIIRDTQRAGLQPRFFAGSLCERRGILNKSYILITESTDMIPKCYFIRISSDT